MKVSMLKATKKATKGCTFEVWSKEIQGLKNCGAPPLVKFGTRNLCVEHAICALSAAENASCYDEKGNEFSSRADFVRLLRMK